jgi:hypothetical protein
VIGACDRLVREIVHRLILQLEMISLWVFLWLLELWRVLPFKLLLLLPRYVDTHSATHMIAAAAVSSFDAALGSFFDLGAAAASSFNQSAAAASSLVVSASLESTITRASIDSFSLTFPEIVCHTRARAAPTHWNWAMDVASDGGPGTSSVVDLTVDLTYDSVDWESAYLVPGLLASL